MSETWFHERTETGWEVRDENRLLVAVVPDVQHEREADAAQIAQAPRLPARATRLARAVALITGSLETDIESLRARVTSLVSRMPDDARALTDRLEAAGPDAVSPTWIAMHVGELVEAQTELAEKRQRLQELRRVLALADAADNDGQGEART